MSEDNQKQKKTKNKINLKKSNYKFHNTSWLYGLSELAGWSYNLYKDPKLPRRRAKLGIYVRGFRTIWEASVEFRRDDLITWRFGKATNSWCDTVKAKANWEKDGRVTATHKLNEHALMRLGGECDYEVARIGQGLSWLCTSEGAKRLVEMRQTSEQCWLWRAALKGDTNSQR